MISIFRRSGGCLDCRHSCASGVMSHNVSSDATVWTAAGSSIAYNCRFSNCRWLCRLFIDDGRQLHEGVGLYSHSGQGVPVDEVRRCRRMYSRICLSVLEVL